MELKGVYAMHYGTVKGVEKPVSRIVLGTTNINTKELEKSFELLDAAFELGCTTFDTAHVYGGGESERTLGQWINQRKNRDKVVILDKGAHHSRDRNRLARLLEPRRGCSSAGMGLSASVGG